MYTALVSSQWHRNHRWHWGAPYLFSDGIYMMLRSTKHSPSPIVCYTLTTKVQLTTMIPATISILVAVAAAVVAFPLNPAKSNPVATLWTFRNETWIESLAVRANGNVLCTSLNRAAIYHLDPFKHTAETLHRFASTDGCLDIAETASDVFIVVTANVSLETHTAWPGSAKMWRVDVRAWEMVSNDPIHKFSSTLMGSYRDCLSLCRWSPTRPMSSCPTGLPLCRTIQALFSWPTLHKVLSDSSTQLLEIILWLSMMRYSSQQLRCP